MMTSTIIRFDAYHSSTLTTQWRIALVFISVLISSPFLLGWSFYLSAADIVPSSRHGMVYITCMGGVGRRYQDSYNRLHFSFHFLVVTVIYTSTYCLILVSPRSTFRETEAHIENRWSRSVLREHRCKYREGGFHAMISPGGTQMAFYFTVCYSWEGRW
jgi:hypothetical protein